VHSVNLFSFFKPEPDPVLERGGIKLENEVEEALKHILGYHCGERRYLSRVN